MGDNNLDWKTFIIAIEVKKYTGTMGDVMREAPTSIGAEDAYFEDITSLGKIARIRRVYYGQTHQYIADMAGVSKQDVELFENDQHLGSIIKRKLLRTYELIVETELEKQLY